MPEVPIADTCACGVDDWHVAVRSAHHPSRAPTHALWCKRCGAVRVVGEPHWQVPLDRAGDVARSVPLDSDEAPTAPGTPRSKRGE